MVKSHTIGSAKTLFETNLLGNLVAAVLPDGTRIDYLVDGSGMRIGKKINATLQQGLLYQSSLRPVAELDGAGTIVSRFVYATQVNVPDYMIREGVTYRIVTDHLGSPRMIVNTTDGSVVQRLDYDEFGNVLIDTNPGFQPFGFAGGLYDGHTKLLHFGARDYDPKTGRWTARDPSGFESGATNLYGYANNDPVNYRDHDGHEGVKIGGTLYVTAKDTVLLTDANVGAERINHLQPGGQVTWLGHVPSTEFEKVGIVHPNKRGNACESAVGYVLRPNLSTKKPNKEFKDSGKPMDSQAYPSHGAGTKG
ncbi:MAG: RHS repeat-associated core domain-containing protein [Gammaproteobacteria bacterium]|nr:RHS repeat-associated core domain-containing protein [Gammaproteobacteria bacterium]